MNGIFGPADILLPVGVDMKKWSVVACDQYTSEPEYWERVAGFVGNAPSTLNMIVPEAALSLDPEFAIGGADATMEKYLADGIFDEHRDAMIYVERTLSTGAVRHGLVGALDLEEYDFRLGSSSAIRATERTVEARLPVRVKVREHAALELPHIMVLIDDPACSVVEPLYKGTGARSPLYDFELMEGGGGLRGTELCPDEKANALAALGKLEKAARAEGRPVIAMGDGNHSLAAAKLCWEAIKPGLTSEQRERHPARYALAELVNLHDPALTFQPIHRVVFGVDREKLLRELDKAQVDRRDVGALQAFLDRYTAQNGGRVDYIHGDETAERLGAGEGCAAFLLPAMEKSSLIPMVVRDGSLPRKAFSLGAAADKRFYLEARRITL